MVLVGDENGPSFLVVEVHGPEASPSIARIPVRTGPIQTQQLVPKYGSAMGNLQAFFLDMVRCLLGSDREGRVRRAAEGSEGQKQWKG